MTSQGRMGSGEAGRARRVSQQRSGRVERRGGVLPPERQCRRKARAPSSGSRSRGAHPPGMEKEVAGPASAQGWPVWAEHSCSYLQPQCPFLERGVAATASPDKCPGTPGRGQGCLLTQHESQPAGAPLPLTGVRGEEGRSHSRWPGRLWGARHVGPTCQPPQAPRHLLCPRGCHGDELADQCRHTCVRTRPRAAPRCPHRVCTQVCSSARTRHPCPHACMLAHLAAHPHAGVHTGRVHAHRPGLTQADTVPAAPAGREDLGAASPPLLRRNPQSSRKEFGDPFGFPINGNAGSGKGGNLPTH